MARLYAALVHYPVLNRRGEIIASAITNLDLHDLARAGRTYDVRACYVVTPLRDQQALSERLLKHWNEGIARELLPERVEALRRIRVVEDIRAAADDIASVHGLRPGIWATTAGKGERRLTHREARCLLVEDAKPYLLLFGTGWGLAPAVFDQVDAVLEPIAGMNGYNHLSVRCAAAILFDRLLRADQSI